MHSFNEGDKAKIVSNKSAHHFDIGEVVTIVRAFNDGSYKAQSISGATWYVEDSELKIVKDNFITKFFKFLGNLFN